MVLISYFLVVCFCLFSFVRAGVPLRFTACLISCAPTGLARTTRHSQILCQGQKRTKIGVFNDKISEFGKIWAKIHDKISETGCFKALFYIFAA